MKAIELCVARFDDDTKESFMDLYTKVDAGVELSVEDDPSEIQFLDDEASDEPQF